MPDIDRDEEVIVIGDYLLRFEGNELSEEFLEIARNDLRETEDVRKNAIIDLLRLLEADEDLYIPSDREDVILQFLRPCKFYPQSAYELMKRFYMFKIKNPKLYKDLLPSAERRVFQMNVASVLPNRDQFGRRLMLIEGGRKWNTRQCSVTDLVRGLIVMIEAAAFEAKTQIAGGVVIMDLEGLSLNHLLQFTPALAKTLVHYIQDCVPVRLKGIHIVNQNYIFNMLFSIFKPFLREKYRNRIHFHGTNWESLLKHIDSKSVPCKYGGEMNIPDELPGADLLRVLSRYDEDFKAIMSFGYSDNFKK